jgi:preprotein translocase subunit SecE
MWERASVFVREVRGELAKVTWPSRAELIQATGVVIALSLFFAVFVGLFDTLLSFLMGQLLG